MPTSSTQSFTISQERYDLFWQQGFVIVPELVEASLMPQLREDYHKAIAGEFGDLKFGGRSKAGKQIQIPVRPGTVPSWEEHPFRLNGQAVAEQLIGRPMRFKYGQIIVKPPHYPANVQWHQDGFYWQAGPNMVNAEGGCSCWLALGPVFPENGSVMYIPSSHKNGLLDHKDVADTTEFDNALEAQGFDVSKAVAVSLNPGDAVFHHSLTLHASGGNTTDIPREGLASHYMPE